MYDATGVRLHAGRQAEVAIPPSGPHFHVNDNSTCIVSISHHNLVANILQVLNQIVYGLPAEHPLAESRPLRELLGHTPPQVGNSIL